MLVPFYLLSRRLVVQYLVHVPISFWLNLQLFYKFLR